MTSHQSVTQAVSGEIRACMARGQHTQGELATVLGLSQPSVSSRLKGDVAWDVDELAKVAQWLDVSLSELIASAA